MKVRIDGYFEMQAGYFFDCTLSSTNFKTIEEVQALGSFSIATGDKDYN